MPEESQPVDEGVKDANPNCTTGNRNACTNAGGTWDFTACECEYPPGFVPENTGEGFDFNETPVAPQIDEQNEDSDDEDEDDDSEVRELLWKWPEL